MEKLIESRGQYDELRYKVGEELRTIQNVKDLLGGDCIKEEYNKYIKALHALKRVFVFSVEEKRKRHSMKCLMTLKMKKQKIWPENMLKHGKKNVEKNWKE